MVARFQRIFAVTLLEALIDEPRGLVIGYGGAGTTATYRSCELQAEMHARFEAGVPARGRRRLPGSRITTGPFGRLPPTDDGRKAMKAHGFFDGVSFGDPSHLTFGTTG